MYTCRVSIILKYLTLGWKYTQVQGILLWQSYCYSGCTFFWHKQNGDVRLNMIFFYYEKASWALIRERPAQMGHHNRGIDERDQISMDRRRRRREVRGWRLSWAPGRRKEEDTCEWLRNVSLTLQSEWQYLSLRHFIHMCCLDHRSFHRFYTHNLPSPSDQSTGSSYIFSQQQTIVMHARTCFSNYVLCFYKLF